SRPSSSSTPGCGPGTRTCSATPFRTARRASHASTCTARTPRGASTRSRSASPPRPFRCAATGSPSPRRRHRAAAATPCRSADGTTRCTWSNRARGRGTWGSPGTGPKGRRGPGPAGQRPGGAGRVQPDRGRAAPAGFSRTGAGRRGPGSGFRAGHDPAVLDRDGQAVEGRDGRLPGGLAGGDVELTAVAGADQPVAVQLVGGAPRVRADRAVRREGAVLRPVDDDVVVPVEPGTARGHLGLGTELDRPGQPGRLVVGAAAGGEPEPHDRSEGHAPQDRTATRGGTGGHDGLLLVGRHRGTTATIPKALLPVVGRADGRLRGGLPNGLGAAQAVCGRVPGGAA